MSDIAAATTRVRAFAWDYLVVLAYLVALTGIGLLLILGPVGAGWSTLMADPLRADLVAFLVAVLPVALYFALSEASAAAATWGKRRVGLVVATVGGGQPGVGRSLLRNGLKFLPWQMAHTAMFHIPGFPAATGEPPTWSVVLLGAAWFLVALYLLGLTRLGRGRPPYDRLAGTAVVARDRQAAGSAGVTEEFASA